ncbi:hypothetical protein AX16_010251 [Volvariella volvacea WC 439]|nr:hypothetical protein AX16_010251 [Volvariella volvacea WC 439]
MSEFHSILGTKGLASASDEGLECAVLDIRCHCVYNGGIRLGYASFKKCSRSEVDILHEKYVSSPCLGREIVLPDEENGCIYDNPDLLAAIISTTTLNLQGNLMCIRSITARDEAEYRIEGSSCSELPTTLFNDRLRRSWLGFIDNPDIFFLSTGSAQIPYLLNGHYQQLQSLSMIIGPGEHLDIQRDVDPVHPVTAPQSLQELYIDISEGASESTAAMLLYYLGSKRFDSVKLVVSKTAVEAKPQGEMSHEKEVRKEKTRIFPANSKWIELAQKLIDSTDGHLTVHAALLDGGGNLDRLIQRTYLRSTVKGSTGVIVEGHLPVVEIMDAIIARFQSFAMHVGGNHSDIRPHCFVWDADDESEEKVGYSERFDILSSAVRRIAKFKTIEEVDEEGSEGTDTEQVDSDSEMST